MKTFGFFLIISMLTRNPLLALLIIVLIYVFIDRSFIGILPDFAAPLRRRQRMARLLREIQATPTMPTPGWNSASCILCRGSTAAAKYLAIGFRHRKQNGGLVRFVKY